MTTTGINTLVLSLNRTEDTYLVATTLAPRLTESGMEIKTWVQLNDFYAKTVGYVRCPVRRPAHHHSC